MNNFEKYLEAAKKQLTTKDAARDIEKAKNRLKGKKVVENFGQTEVGKLRDKYSDHQYKNDGIWKQILSFDNWCQNYTGK